MEWKRERESLYVYSICTCVHFYLRYCERLYVCMYVFGILFRYYCDKDAIEKF